MNAYRVVVTREGEDWLADVPDLRGAHTYAHNLESLDRFVREVVVLAEDLPDGAGPELELAWEYHTGEDVLDKELAKLRQARESLDAERSRIEQLTATFAHDLAARSYSVRDTAALLGVSRARAQQLVAEVA